MDFTLHESILIIVSVLSTAACFNLALYFGYNRKLAYLFFAFYCVFHCFKIYLNSYPPEEILVQSLYLSAFDLKYLSVLLGMTSLNVFLAYHFSLRHRKWFITTFTLFSIIFFLAFEEVHYIGFSLAVAIIQTVYSLKNNRLGLIILIGLLAFTFCVALGFNDLLNNGYFIGIVLLIFCMVLSSSIELSAQNKEYQNALLRSSRLENQLLKTTIQPHFILNSLTSLQELIEHSPTRASSFVQDLSKEFELFAKISDSDFILVKDELALISSYIGIMSVRKSTDFKLKTENLSEHDEIPPGVFLTLVENGISHGYEDRTTGVFSITKQVDGNTKIYSVFNDGEVPEEPKRYGMGLNYVLARLKESYGENFTFESSASKSGWLSTITVWG